MRRGDVVTVAVAGDYGKPRPAVIVQSDAFPETHASVGGLSDDLRTV
jgi:mRNA interferase MazF